MKKRILCVDDEAIILICLTEELKFHLGKDYEIESAFSGTEALSMIQEMESEGNQFDLIITDWMMPEIKGDELLLKIHNRYPKIKSIMITGYADENAKKKVMENPGTLAVFTKPWEAIQLVDLIKENCNSIEN